MVRRQRIVFATNATRLADARNKIRAKASAAHRLPPSLHRIVRSLSETCDYRLKIGAAAAPKKYEDRALAAPSLQWSHQCATAPTIFRCVKTSALTEISAPSECLRHEYATRGRQNMTQHRSALCCTRSLNLRAVTHLRQSLPKSRLISTFFYDLRQNYLRFAPIKKLLLRHKNMVAFLVRCKSIVNIAELGLCGARFV